MHKTHMEYEVLPTLTLRLPRSAISSNVKECLRRRSFWIKNLYKKEQRDLHKKQTSSL
jgi:hypothetical protein